MTFLRPATPEDIKHVALNMRDSDYREIVALTWVNGREALAGYILDMVQKTPGLVIAYGHRQPIAIGSVLMIRPGVASLGFFATDEFPAIRALILRRRGDLLRLARDLHQFHRLQTVALASNCARWITANGGKFECTLQGYGRNGEDYNVFVWR